MVNFLHPHQPLTPPPFYYDRYMAMELPEPYVGGWARVFEKPKRGLPPECWREFIHGECATVPTTGGGMQYLTDGRRKYIWWPGRGVEQYFNLEEDPDELVDNTVPIYSSNTCMLPSAISA